MFETDSSTTIQVAGPDTVQSFVYDIAKFPWSKPYHHNNRT